MPTFRIWALGAVVSVSSMVVTPGAAAISPGDLDPSFGNGGTVTTTIGTRSGANGALVEPNGKVVLAGEANPAAIKEFAVVRYNQDGSLDQSFAGDGSKTVAIGTEAAASTVLREPGGKLLVVGSAALGGRLQIAAVRLNADGSVDASYGNSGVATALVGSASTGFAAQLQPDGKLVVAGAATVGGQTVPTVARLNPGGGVDQGFGSSGAATLPIPGAAWSLALPSDGKIVLAGESRVGGAKQFLAARLQASGAPDPGFGDGGVRTIPIGGASVANGVVLGPNGTVVPVGSAFTTHYLTAVARLDSSGSLDPSFQASEIGLYETGPTMIINGAALQANGKIVAIGTGTMRTVRLTADGQLDASFAGDGIAEYPIGSPTAANAVVVQPDGMLLLAGATVIDSTLRFAAARVAGDLVPSAAFTYTPATVAHKSPVKFDAGASADRDGTITRYSWDFGDGSQATGVQATHKFAKRGTYEVSLEVTDDDGLSAKTARTLRIR